MAAIYLAARYSRRLELCGYRDQLEAAGYTVTARWLGGGHRIGDDGLPAAEDGSRVAVPAGATPGQGAEEDALDIEAAQILVAFTEQPRGGGRGGRHFEMGYALGLRLRVLVAGPREHPFCWLPAVEWHPAWDSALASLTAPARAAT